MLRHRLLAVCTLLLMLPFGVSALEAPAGVRPCCAFGTNLKAQVGGVPVPFFSLENLVDAGEFGSHVYNDGRQGVAGSLLGMADELNGLIYTRRGGFIDIAHVRDTADYTYYLYHELWPYIGSEHALTLPPELRLRQVVMHADQVVHDNDSKRQQGIKLAGMLAFQLAQWHEVAQWFGLKSVGGWSELASAFSPEDLYSNMLGAKLAIQVLEQIPTASVKEFSQAFEVALDNALKKMGEVEKAETQRRIKALDGDWWDSSKRLPEKWVLLKRDYHLGLELMPHAADVPMPLRLDISQYGELRLLPDASESSFKLLPEPLLQMPFWRGSDFQVLADFAREQDILIRSDADIRLGQ